MAAKTGRPQGAKNVQTTQIVEASACPKCGVTDRDAYRLVNCVAIAGTTKSGKPYTHVVSRRTRCTACKYKRTDKFFENHAPVAHPGDTNEPDSTK